MTGLWPEGCGRLPAAGCVSLRSGGDSACGAEGGGGGFAADYKESGPRPPSFRPKRSGVEKSHSTMVHAALRQEISRLRASWERFPSAPYRHAAPLEMTVATSNIQSFQKGMNPIPVISAEAKRSGEISPSDGTGGITVGDLSTQSIMGAFSLCPIPTRSSARDDGGDEQHWTHLRCEGSEGEGS